VSRLPDRLPARRTTQREWAKFFDAAIGVEIAQASWKASWLRATNWPTTLCVHSGSTGRGSPGLRIFLWRSIRRELLGRNASRAAEHAACSSYQHGGESQSGYLDTTHRVLAIISCGTIHWPSDSPSIKR